MSEILAVLLSIGGFLLMYFGTLLDEIIKPHHFDRLFNKIY
jgi:hypothetical protein